MNGSLTHLDYLDLFNSKEIESPFLNDSQIQPASLDLTLSNECYEIEYSFLCPQTKVRNKLKKVSSISRYRLSVSRSAKNISAQIIDGNRNITLVSATSSGNNLVKDKKTKSELSILVAEKLAERAKEKKIEKIYFDRGIYKYHGRVKKFAETLRKNGMEF